MIRCRGRNGPFSFHESYTWSGAELGGVEIFSNSPHTRAAPVSFTGPPREVVKLLRKIARELETAHRAALAHNPKA